MKLATRFTLKSTLSQNLEKNFTILRFNLKTNLAPKYRKKTFDPTHDPREPRVAPYHLNPSLRRCFEEQFN